MPKDRRECMTRPQTNHIVPIDIRNPDLCRSLSLACPSLPYAHKHYPSPNSFPNAPPFYVQASPHKSIHVPTFVSKMIPLRVFPQEATPRAPPTFYLRVILLAARLNAPHQANTGLKTATVSVQPPSCSFSL